MSELAFFGDPFAAINLVTRILGVAVCVTSLEIFASRRDFSDSGILAWDSLNRRLPRLKKMAVAKFFFEDPAYGWWWAVRAAAGAGLIFASEVYWLAVPCLGLILFSGFLTDVRNFVLADTVMQRMQMIVGGALFIRGFAWENDMAALAVLVFVALNAVLTYFFSALEKMRFPDWRSGRQVYQIANGEWLGSRPLAASLKSRPRLTRILTRGTIGFELVFPAALIVGLPWAWGFVALSLLFHGANWLLLGLRGFVLTFASTWPAILFTSGWLNRLVFGS